MNVRFLKPAQLELDDAVAWYNEQAAGLGVEFLDEFDRAMRRSGSRSSASRTALPVGSLDKQNQRAGFEDATSENLFA